MTERVITVGIGQVLLASATSGFSSCIKLAYCSSAQELQQLRGKSISLAIRSWVNTQLGSDIFFGVSLLSRFSSSILNDVHMYFY